MKLNFKFDGGLEKWGNAFGAVAERAPVVLARAMNRACATAKSASSRALVQQTGLKFGVIKRALKESRAAQGDPTRGYEGSKLTYSLTSSGGSIRIRFFGARETRAGVAAAPKRERRLYPGSFIRGGAFPKRVNLALGGHVFQRAGASRLPIGQLRSGLFIPDEMIDGASAAAFEQAFGSALEKRIAHELFRLIK